MVSLYNQQQQQQLLLNDQTVSNKRLTPVFLMGFLLSSLCLSASANEQLVDNKPLIINTLNKDIYSGQFFAQYFPQNALEMIERIPGFNFDGGSNERGFGGNAGNVLIDNARPTSKSGGLRSALVRIPAAQVDRIEILRGSSGNTDAAGQSIVANVIKKQQGTSGSWAFKLRRAPKGQTLPNVEAAINRAFGEWKTAFDMDLGGGPGYRTTIIENRDAAEQLESSSNEIFKDHAKWLFVNGEGAHNTLGGLLTLNGRIGGDIWKADLSRDIFQQRLPDSSEIDGVFDLAEENQFKMAELGIDWTKTTDESKLQIIGLGLINDREYENQVYSNDYLENELYTANFQQQAVKTEFIARTTFSLTGDQKLRSEYGIEVAKNKLRSDSFLIEDGETVDLSGADVTVSELRSELFATFAYKLNTKLSIDGGLTGEFSEIQVSGDNQNKQNFTYLKPTFSTSYQADDDTQLSLSIERRVGQLDFNDFAASNQAEDNNVTSGNPDLKPDTKDELKFTYDWSFSDKGSLKVQLFHQWRSDILEYIELENQGNDDADKEFAIGNAGDARYWGVYTDFNLPLDPLLKNGLLEVTHRYRRSKFDDPITNDERSINGYTPDWLSFKLRQDITEQQLAWGIEYWGHFTDTNYFVDEKQTFHGNKRLRFFIETSRYFGMKTQLEITHLNTGEYTRSRFFYDPDRSEEYSGSEIARRERKPEIKLSFSGSF